MRGQEQRIIEPFSIETSRRRKKCDMKFRFKRVTRIGWDRRTQHESKHTENRSDATREEEEVEKKLKENLSKIKECKSKLRNFTRLGTLFSFPMERKGVSRHSNTQ